MTAFHTCENVWIGIEFAGYEKWPCVHLINVVADFINYSNMISFQPQRKRTKKVNVHDTMFDTIPQFRHSDELERIYDMKRFGGDIKYLVQYKDCDEPEWISVTIIKRTFPHKVIEFYEKCITWENWIRHNHHWSIFYSIWILFTIFCFILSMKPLHNCKMQPVLFYKIWKSVILIHW